MESQRSKEGAAMVPDQQEALHAARSWEKENRVEAPEAVTCNSSNVIFHTKEQLPEEWPDLQHPYPNGIDKFLDRFTGRKVDIGKAF